MKIQIFISIDHFSQSGEGYTLELSSLFSPYSPGINIDLQYDDMACLSTAVCVCYPASWSRCPVCKQPAPEKTLVPLFDLSGLSRAADWRLQHTQYHFLKVS